MDPKTAQPSSAKKLLEIIEEGGADSSSGNTQIKSSAVKAIASVKAFSLPDFIGGIKSSIEKLKSGFTLANFDVKKLNLVLLVVSVGMVFGAIFYFINYRNSVVKNMDSLMVDFGKVSAKGLKMPGLEQISPDEGFLAEILARVRNRDLFKPFVKKETPVLGGGNTSEKLTEAVKKLKLVGISYAGDSTNTYAMVENTSTNQTFFLRKGEMILDVKITDIKDDRVVFGYQDQEMELR